MENTTPLDQNLGNRVLTKRDLPDGGGILTLGILSIVLAGLIGLILGIIALSKSKRPLELYAEDPAAYTESSVSRVKSGRVCAIIGVSLSGVSILIILALSAG